MSPGFLKVLKAHRSRDFAIGYKLSYEKWPKPLGADFGGTLLEKIVQEQVPRDQLA